MMSLAGTRVAVAEDEPLLLEVLKDSLKMAGAELVQCADDVSGAVALASLERLDVAVLDIDLRDGRSFAAAAALRHRGVGVLFASGSSPGDIPQDLRSCPMIRKPYTYRDLVRGVRAAVEAWSGEKGSVSVTA